MKSINAKKINQTIQLAYGVQWPHFRKWWQWFYKQPDFTKDLNLCFHAEISLILLQGKANNYIVELHRIVERDAMANFSEDVFVWNASAEQRSEAIALFAVDNSPKGS